MCALIVGFAAAIAFGCRGFFGFTGEGVQRWRGCGHSAFCCQAANVPWPSFFVDVERSQQGVNFAGFFEVKRIFLLLAMYNPVPKMKPSICLIK